MNAEQIVAAIVEHGLSVRQIPHTVTSCREMTHFKPGDSVVEAEVTTMSFAEAVKRAVNPANWRFDYQNQKVFRRYAKRVEIPENAGYWMCQKVNHTSGKVSWITKDHHLAPTLAESITLFLSI